MQSGCLAMVFAPSFLKDKRISLKESAIPAVYI